MWSTNFIIAKLHPEIHPLRVPLFWLLTPAEPNQKLTFNWQLEEKKESEPCRRLLQQWLGLDPCFHLILLDSDRGKQVLLCWAACAPIVVIGAPLGSLFLTSRMALILRRARKIGKREQTREGRSLESQSPNWKGLLLGAGGGGAWVP